jgi:putative transposase
MLSFLTAVFATLSSVFRSRSAFQLENLALRHQIGVLQRVGRKRPKLMPRDRLLWVWLSRIWSGWQTGTTCRFSRGSKSNPQDVSGESELGCTPGSRELLKLGIDIGETSVSKYMVRCQLLQVIFEEGAPGL